MIFSIPDKLFSNRIKWIQTLIR